MRTGRPPKSKTLHLLHGNPSHKKLDAIEEPATRGPLGPPPEFLDEGAREVWLDLQRVVPLGVIASCDLPTMCAYCNCVALHRLAMIQMRETGGAVVRNHDGDLVKNPWLFVQDRQAVLILRLASELGLTATSRSYMAARLATAAATGFGLSGKRQSPNALDEYLAAKPDRLPEPDEEPN
jgi:P27 family predicted phage terminase small subunit